MSLPKYDISHNTDDVFYMRRLNAVLDGSVLAFATPALAKHFHKLHPRRVESSGVWKVLCLKLPKCSFECLSDGAFFIKYCYAAECGVMLPMFLPRILANVTSAIVRFTDPFSLASLGTYSHAAGRIVFTHFILSWQTLAPDVLPDTFTESNSTVKFSGVLNTDSLCQVIMIAHKARNIDISKLMFSTYVLPMFLKKLNPSCIDHIICSEDVMDDCHKILRKFPCVELKD